MRGRPASAGGQREITTVIRKNLGLLAVGLSLLPSCQASEFTAPGNGGGEQITEPGVLASGYGITDAIAVIGEEEFLFAERSGALHHYVGGEVTELQGIPASRTVDGGRYGGLLDVSLHPDFADNRLVYIAYDDAAFGLAVARFEFRDDRARNLEVIYESNEFSIGSRIAWEDASHFFLSFGVGGSPLPAPGPQDLGSDVGKIHRLTADGQIPPDNPLLPGASVPSTIWSYGHRNPQGLHYDAATRTLYENEHGPMGGDELNIITAGGNYGWPLFSYGLNYDGTPVSDMTEEEAAAVSILPFKFWGPDFRVAPSGLLLVEDSHSPSWNGSFLMGALNPQHLLRYDPATDETEIVVAGVGRVRDVAQLPSGKLLISVDAGSPNASNSGRIIQLPPGGGLP
ncbi:MAG: PQQ-dependent sugar dehydrogenase [Gemmatimonadales bacterium]|jgi:glucose/arabinose dehydrogenase